MEKNNHPKYFEKKNTKQTTTKLQQNKLVVRKVECATIYLEETGTTKIKLMIH